MSGDLLGSPKPKEMAAGGLADRRRWRPNTSDAAAAGTCEAAALGGANGGGVGGGGVRWGRGRGRAQWGRRGLLLGLTAPPALARHSRAKMGGAANPVTTTPRHPPAAPPCMARHRRFTAPWQ